MHISVTEKCEINQISCFRLHKSNLLGNRPIELNIELSKKPFDSIQSTLQPVFAQNRANNFVSVLETITIELSSSFYDNALSSYCHILVVLPTRSLLRSRNINIIYVSSDFFSVFYFIFSYFTENRSRIK